MQSDENHVTQLMNECRTASQSRDTNINYQQQACTSTAVMYGDIHDNVSVENIASKSAECQPSSNILVSNTTPVTTSNTTSLTTSASCTESVKDK